MTSRVWWRGCTCRIGRLTVVRTYRIADQPADAAHCWLASLSLILAHCSKIVFGVLEVILGDDPIPGQSFGAGQDQIAFIASLEVLNITRLGVDESGRLISLGGLRSSQHSVGHYCRILARPPGEQSRSFALGAARKYLEGI
jgi:hypothetical protein